MTQTNIYKTRVVAVLQSANMIIQDFYTPRLASALVQFGAGMHNELDCDPLFRAIAFEIPQSPHISLEETTNTYIGWMLRDLEEAKGGAN
jgi:hypothetical protein